MIRIDNVDVFGFEGALRGMRNPYMNHEKKDSCIENRNFESLICKDCRYGDYDEHKCKMPYFDEEVYLYGVQYIIGNNDLKLCKKLIKAGPEHRKFLRMIHVQADVLAPRYWWAEMDKYKYVEANSSSTMHLIGKRKLTLEDFSCDGSMKDMLHMEYAIGNINTWIEFYLAWDKMNIILKNSLEKQGIFNKTDLVRFIKQLLPESYNQMRTIDTNYECLLAIYHQRKNHRLTEWEEFCKWCLTLPYFKEFIGALNGEN